MTKSSTKRPAVLYARKSSRDDRSEEQSASVEAQLEAGRAYAAKHGLTVVSEHTDDGRSGLLDRTKRPGLDAALKVLEAGEADTIVMLWKSRLSRDEVDRAVMVRDFEQRGVTWVAMADGGKVDRSTYAGYLKDGVDALFDTSYSIRVRENWQRVHKGRLEEGMPKTGNLRFGYTRELRYDRRTGREFPSGPFELDPVTGPVLHKLYEKYVNGSGFTPLVQWLNAQSLPTTTGTTWTVSTLSRMLDSGFGAGRISKEAAHRDLIGIHERVIDEDMWQRYLSARRKAAAKSPKGGSPRWYLAGIVKCGLCGGSTFINSFASPKSSVECSAHRADPDRCTGKMRAPRSFVEWYVSMWLGAHLDELADLLPAREEARAQAQAVVAAAQAELEETDAALGRLAVRWARGAMDDAAYEGAETELRAERAQQDGALTEARDRLAELGPAPLDVFDRLEQAEDESAGEFGARLSKLLRRIELHPDKLVLVPVVGKPETVERPNLRAEAARRREAAKRAA